MDRKRMAQPIEELESIYGLLSLKGKTAVVTGAAGGIGRSTSAAMAELGANVVMSDLPSRESTLREYAAVIEKKHNACVYAVPCDVTRPESVDNLINQAIKRFDSVYIVHNNAGICPDYDDIYMPLESWQKTIAVNLTGPYLVARAAAQAMIKGGIGGSIVTTSSMSGLVVNTGSAYAATKAGVRHMTNALAIELAEYNIRCNSVCFGYILSGAHESMVAPEGNTEDMYRRFENNTPLGRIGTLSDATGCVIYFASDLSRFATGSTLVVDGGYSTL